MNGKCLCLLLLRFFGVVFFAHLIYSQWLLRHISEPLLNKISIFMSSCLETVSYMMIHEKMHEKRYYWSTFIPFIQLLYFPEAYSSLQHDSTNWTLQQTLCNLCSKTGLMCAKYLCLADNADSVFEHEGLLDYLTCAPWVMPTRELRESAQELVLLARNKVSLQPPSLTGLIKAQLAAQHCGLQRVLDCDAYSLILQLN